jgi:hypothetical protein
MPPAGQIYTANIPAALIFHLQTAGLVVRTATDMNGARAEELRFLPGAMEFVIGFFTKQ